MTSTKKPTAPKKINTTVSTKKPTAHATALSKTKPKKGGAMIGVGEYGCVYSPIIPCEHNLMVSTSNNAIVEVPETQAKVGKVMETNHMDIETGDREHNTAADD